MLQFLILAGAIWRISAFLVTEDGPFRIFRRMRKRLGAGEFGGATLDATRLTPVELDQAMMRTSRGVLGNLLSCIWCTSVWVSLAVLVIQEMWAGSMFIWTVLALSTTAILIDSLQERGYGRG